MKKAAFFTLGCKVNSYDSAFMQELFLNSGYTLVPFGEKADIVVVNTCTVTATADKKSRAALRRAAAAGKVIAAGCMAQKNAEKLLEMDGVCAVIGTDERSKIVNIADEIIDGHEKIDATKDISGCGFEKMDITNTGSRTRAVIKIQEGCDNFCSYCIIPYVRGRSRSRNFNDIINEAQRLAEGGAKEIVLTGIHIASYENSGCGLADVILALDKINGIRIRLGSIEPGFLGENFIKKASDARSLCPHFHLSLQSGSETVLKRMNRKYTPGEYYDFTALLRKYFDNPAITTDIITGFPGETQDEHEQTMDFVKKISFSRIHVFPFSAREGTAAYKMPNKVPKSIAKQRAKQLIELGEILEKEYLCGLVGKSEQVLFEEKSNAFSGCLEGYGKRYIRIAGHAKNNDLKNVILEKICDKIIYGREI